MHYSFPVIGIVHSCFKEKFGIPRQPGLAPLAQGRLEILAPYNDPDAFTGLSGCSHIWLQFVFHQNRVETWKPKVKPPRLGGNQSVGVFATRAPTRPSPIGLSVVKLVDVQVKDGVNLILGGIDLVDGTPVLDIKPYVPYVDLVLAATNDFASATPHLTRVIFSPEVARACAEHTHYGVKLQDLIQQLLQQDPKPQYQKPEPTRIYGMKLFDFDVRWRYVTINDVSVIEVVELEFPHDKSATTKQFV